MANKRSLVALAVVGALALAGCSKRASSTTSPTIPAVSADYRVLDTQQSACFDTMSVIACAQPGQEFYGQDSQNAGNVPSYTISGDGRTVYEAVSGLTWQRSPDTNADGAITASDKMTWAAAQARPAALNAAKFGGYSDWRLPTIKELYSLIDFRGMDPSGLTGDDTSGLTPFIDTRYFGFAYGQTSAGERIIDSQYASSTLYASPVGEHLLFGVNFADGRIKGYGLTMPGSNADKTFFVQCVRGNSGYGINSFADNGDSTITDAATGLMWDRDDSGAGMDWKAALAWVQAKNAANHRGHDDWRLPNAKELQSLVDYTRAPDATSSAAIDPVFATSAIVNEAGQSDFPSYWTGTTHMVSTGDGPAAVYVCFGRAMGFMQGVWQDVHGAGCQRSDPKSGNPADFPTGRGPQGDAIRILNYVRLVRGAS